MIKKILDFLFSNWNGGYVCGLFAGFVLFIVLVTNYDFKREPETFEVIYTQGGEIYQMWDNGTYERLEYVIINGDSVLVDFGQTKKLAIELYKDGIK